MQQALPYRLPPLFAGEKLTSGIPGAVERDMRAVLEELCAASLLIGSEDATGGMRFRMLDTLRAFGLEQLQKSGEDAETRRQHLRWLAQQARAPQIREDDEFRFLSAEDADVRAALTFGLRPEAEEEEQSLTLQLAGALPDYWRARANLSEGRDFLRRALALPGAENLQAEARSGAARLAIYQGDYEEAQSLAQTGVERAQAAGDMANLAENLFSLGLIAFHHGDYADAQTRLEEALTLYDTLNNRKRHAECLSSLGLVAWYGADHAKALERLEAALKIQQERDSRRGVAACLLRMGNIVRDKGDLIEGKALLEQALQAFRDLEDRSSTATALHDLGLVTMFQGDAAQAERFIQEALRIQREIGALQGCGSCLHNLGQIRLTQSRWEEGRALTQEALDIYRKIGDRRHIASTTHNLGVAAEGMGNRQEARELLLEALQLDRDIHNAHGIANTLDRLGHLSLAQNELQSAHAYFAEALAINRKTGSRLGQAYVLQSLVFLFAKLEKPEQAARLAGSAAFAIRSMTYRDSPDETRDLERVLAALRQTLGEEAFESCRLQGEAMPLETAAAEAAAIIA